MGSNIPWLVSKIQQTTVASLPQTGTFVKMGLAKSGATSSDKTRRHTNGKKICVVGKSIIGEDDDVAL